MNDKKDDLRDPMGGQAAEPPRKVAQVTEVMMRKLVCDCECQGGFAGTILHQAPRYIDVAPRGGERSHVAEPNEDDSCRLSGSRTDWSWPGNIATQLDR